MRPEPFAAVLAPGHTSPLLELQNTKKMYGTKNNRVPAQLGQSLDKRYKKIKKKTPAAIFEKPRAKTGCWELKQPTEHAPRTHRHQRGGQNT